MQKVIFSTEDIIEEFNTRADMKWLTFWQIASVLPIIERDAFSLVLRTKSFKNPTVKLRVYMVEWTESDGIPDSDEWLRPPANFLGAFAEGYVREAMKLRTSLSWSN